VGSTIKRKLQEESLPQLTRADLSIPCSLASRKFIKGGVGKWELSRKSFHAQGMLKIVAKPKLQSSL